jgi:hypothetical protein
MGNRRRNAMSVKDGEFDEIQISFEARRNAFRRLVPDGSIMDLAHKVMEKDKLAGIFANAPSHMVEGLLEYVLLGTRQGGFLNALLRNDFMKAMTKADDVNLRRIHDWAIVLYNYVPSGCYGSDQKVDNWILQGGLVFIHKL